MTFTALRAYVEAYETMGTVEGTDEKGQIVTLALDHRVIRHMIEDMDAGEHVVFEPEPWQIVLVQDPAEAREGTPEAL